MTSLSILINLFYYIQESSGEQAASGARTDFWDPSEGLHSQAQASPVINERAIDVGENGGNIR